MLNNDPFGWDLTRKYMSVFGNLFKEVYVVRTDAAGAETQRIRVPISYGPREKVLGRLEGDPSIDRPAAVTLPSMSFEMGSPSLDTERKISPINRKVVYFSNGYHRQLQPVPYNFPFTLHVQSKSLRDGTYIIEQILPFFQPEFPTTMQLVPEMNQLWDVPIVLNNVTYHDDWEGNFEDRRYIGWDLDFTMRAYLFGPLITAPVIKFVDVRLYTPATNTAAEGVGISPAVDEVTVKPGLTANGQPTTNAAASIPYLQIQAGDDWGFVVHIAGNLDPSEGTGGS